MVIIWWMFDANEDIYKAVTPRLLMTAVAATQTASKGGTASTMRAGCMRKTARHLIDNVAMITRVCPHHPSWLCQHDVQRFCIKNVRKYVNHNAGCSDFLQPISSSRIQLRSTSVSISARPG